MRAAIAIVIRNRALSLVAVLIAGALVRGRTAASS